MLEQYSGTTKTRSAFFPLRYLRMFKGGNLKNRRFVLTAEIGYKYGPFSAGSTLHLTDFHFGLSKAEVPFALPVSNFFHL